MPPSPSAASSVHPRLVPVRDLPGVRRGATPGSGSRRAGHGRPQARRAHQLAERAGLTEEHLAALLSVGVSDTGRGAATQYGTGQNTAEVYALAAEAAAALGGYAREYLLRRPTGSCTSATAPSRPRRPAPPWCRSVRRNRDDRSRR